MAKKNTEKTKAVRIAELKKFVKEYLELVDKYQAVLDSPMFGVQVIDLENERKHGNPAKEIKDHLKEMKQNLLDDCTEAVADYDLDADDDIDVAGVEDW